MKTATILLTAAALASPLEAQEKTPAAPKTPTHSASQSSLDKLNKKLKDKGLQDELRKAKDKLTKAGADDAAAKKEMDRMQNDKSLPSSEDAKSKLDRLRKSTDESDLEELKNLLKDNKPALEEEIKNFKARMQERIKKEGPPHPAAPAPAPDPLQGSFGDVRPPGPLPLLKAPDFGTPLITSERAIKGPSRDPKNPDRDLPDSDPRTRTYVLSGNVTLRQPTTAVDADEVDLLLKQGENLGDRVGAGKEKPPGPDPVNRPKSENSPFERIVARRNVRIMFVDKSGNVQAARGGSLLYDDKSGWFVIKDYPEAEFDGKLVRGKSKDSVIRISRLHEVTWNLCEVVPLDRSLTPEDFPRTPDKAVPAAAPVRTTASPAPSPAPR